MGVALGVAGLILFSQAGAGRAALAADGGSMDGVQVVDAVVEDLFTKLTRGSEQVLEVRA